MVGALDPALRGALAPTLGAFSRLGIAILPAKGAGGRTGRSAALLLDVLRGGSRGGVLVTTWPYSRGDGVAIKAMRMAVMVLSRQLDLRRHIG